MVLLTYAYFLGKESRGCFAREKTSEAQQLIQTFTHSQFITCA